MVHMYKGIRISEAEAVKVVAINAYRHIGKTPPKRLVDFEAFMEDAVDRWHWWHATRGAK